jgi:ABC-type multidrug transport system fused ATPase/permease subunit
VLALVLALSLSGPAVSSIGDAYFLVSLYVRLFVPVTNLLSRYDDIRRSEATSRTYLELLAQPLPNRPADLSMATPSLEGVEVRLEALRFMYSFEPQPKGLTECTFMIPKGSVTLLLGPSGCGKTTVARLLLGFMRAQSGRIFLDDKDSSTMGGHELRLLMSYVSQGDYVIDDTVRENLSWSPDQLSDSELCSALVELRISQADEAIALLDRPARSLSIGQQQRLSLCRVLLDRAPLLILDEPLAGVDLFTVRDVMPALIRSITETKRTVLLISHRISFVSHAAHVVIMDQQGVVVEEGHPAQMLSEETSVLFKLYKTALIELGAAAIPGSA